MTGRKITLPKGTKLDGNKIINPQPRAKDASQAMAWRKSKRSRPVTKARAALNAMGKAK
jgi:hypothetical protein